MVTEEPERRPEGRPPGSGPRNRLATLVELSARLPISLLWQAFGDGGSGRRAGSAPVGLQRLPAVGHDVGRVGVGRPGRGMSQQIAGA